MVKAFYNDFDCAVVDEEDTTDWSKIRTGVKQESNMSGLLFMRVVDWVLRKTLQESNSGISWKIEDIDSADDVALISSSKQHIQIKTDKLSHEAGKVGLKVNVELCKLSARN